MLTSEKMMLALLLHRRPTVLVATVGVGLALGGCGRGATSLPASAPSSSGAGGATTSVRASAETATARPASTVSTAPTSAVGGPTSTATASQPSPPTGSGAYGYVTAGPTCPVERPDQPCPPRPVAAQVDAQDASGRTVATTRTDQAGRYSLGLAAGTYTLVAVTGATYPRCPPTSVTVRPVGPTRADINCDTGIR
jgi:hypothetical protein